MLRARGRTRWQLPGVLLSCLLAACGTTVPMSAGVPDSLPSQDGAALPDGSTLGGSLGAPTPAQAGADSQLPSARVEASGGEALPGAGTAQRAGAGVLPSGPVSGRGFTKDKVYIGMATWKEVNSVGFILAGADFDFGDQEADARAVMAHLNAQGGLAGRRMEPVFYDHKTATDTATSVQEACALWTQDRPVFAVVLLNTVGGDDEIAACLGKYDVPLINMYYNTRPQELLTRNPRVHLPATPTRERFIPTWLERGKAIGFFTGWDTTFGQPGSAPVKLGIIGWHDNNFIPLVKRAAEARGLQVAATAGISEWFAGSQVSNAVLSFKTQGVTHVIPDSVCVGLSPFLANADSQQYRPRYLIDTGNCPMLLPTVSTGDQLVGAMGAGYQPVTDNPVTYAPVSPALSRCKKIMEQAGQRTSSSNALSIMAWTCDGLDFLYQAIKNGGGLTTARYLAGADSIRSLPSASGFAINLPNGRRDGAEFVRDLAYRKDCECFRYLNATNHRI